MSLGIGGATPFNMKSDHQTVYNHSYRDVSQYDPARNTKIKCSFCGCWAKKGSACYQCKRRVGGVPTSYPSSSSISYAAQQQSGGGAAPLSARRPTPDHHYQQQQQQQHATSHYQDVHQQQHRQQTPPVRYLNHDNQQQQPQGQYYNQDGGQHEMTSRSSTGRTSRANSAAATRRRPADNALTHSFRDTSAYDTSARLRVKCRYCGCWASRGTHCTFCRTFNK